MRRSLRIGVEWIATVSWEHTRVFITAISWNLRKNGQQHLFVLFIELGIEMVDAVMVREPMH